MPAGASTGDYGGRAVWELSRRSHILKLEAPGLPLRRRPPAASLAGPRGAASD
jgi:hypothetical protein